jgi:hypothetical protein
MSKSIALSKGTNLLCCGHSRGKISPPNNSRPLVNELRLKNSPGHMEPSTSAAEAIPHEELLPPLAQYCLTEQMVRALGREPGFDEL